MIGWRVGWVTGPAAILPTSGWWGLTNVVCQDGPAQQAMAAALDAPDGRRIGGVFRRNGSGAARWCWSNWRTTRSSRRTGAGRC